MLHQKVIDELETILERSQFILNNTRGLEFEGFIGNQLVLSAVERDLEVIGIASWRIREFDRDFFEDFQHLRDPIAVRNRLAHGYDDDISLEILWKIITEGIPELMEQIRLRI